MQQIFIDGFNKPHIIVSDGDIIFCQLFNGFCYQITDMSNGENGKVISVPDQPACPHFDFLHWFLPVGQYTTSPGVTNRKRPLIVKLCSIHEVP